MENEKDILTALPAELFWKILELLELRDVCTLLCVNSQLRQKCAQWPVQHIDASAYRKELAARHIIPMVKIWGSSLRHLTLTQCEVDDSVLLAVSEYAPNLERLYAGKTNISDAGITAVARSCPNLRVLSVPFTSISSESLFEVARCCPKLELLSLRECRGVNSSSVTAVASRCRNLKTAFLDGCVQFWL